MWNGLDNDYWERPVKVNCKECGQMNEEDTEFVDIEEDMQGHDILTFICPICHETRKSKRLG